MRGKEKKLRPADIPSNKIRRNTIIVDEEIEASVLFQFMQYAEMSIPQYEMQSAFDMNIRCVRVYLLDYNESAVSVKTT